MAARFSEESQATAALDLLQRELNRPDVAVAPMARPGEPATGDALLAGRFPDDQAHAVVELVERAGGEIVADIDESWTGLNDARSRVSSASATAPAPDAPRAGRMYRFD